MKDRDARQGYFRALTLGIFDIIRRVSAFRCERIRKKGKAHVLEHGPQRHERIENFASIINDPQKLQRFIKERLEPCGNTRLVRPPGHGRLDGPDGVISGAELIFQMLAAYEQKFPGGRLDGANDRDLYEDIAAEIHLMYVNMGDYYRRVRGLRRFAWIMFGLQPVLLLLWFIFHGFFDVLDLGISVFPAVLTGLTVLQLSCTVLVAFITLTRFDKLTNPLKQNLLKLAETTGKNVKLRMSEHVLLMEQMISAASQAHTHAHETENPKAWLDVMILWLDMSWHTGERFTALPDYHVIYDWLRHIVYQGMRAEAQYRSRFFNFLTFHSLSKSLVKKVLLAGFAAVTGVSLITHKMQLFSGIMQTTEGVVFALMLMHLTITVSVGSWLEMKTDDPFNDDFIKEVSREAGIGPDDHGGNDPTGSEPPDPPHRPDGNLGRRYQDLRNKHDRLLGEWLHKRETSYRG